MVDDVKINEADSSTREIIFLSAARLFSQKGYNGVSMRELAEQSGISKPAIYYYFGSKEGIYTSLVQMSFSYSEKFIKEIFNNSVAVKEKLILLTKLHFDLSMQYPEFTKFLLTILSATDKLPFLDSLRKEAEKRRKLIAELVKQGIEKGEFGASADPNLAAEIFIGSISHFLWKQVNSKKKILSNLLAEQIVELLFKGLNE